MTSTQKPRTEYASPGAVNQTGGSLQIRKCNRCGDEIVFCKSSRTGKSYPVNVSRGHHDQRFYIGANVHKCQAEERKAAIADTLAREDAAKAQIAKLIEMQAKLASGEITRDDMIAWVNAGMPTR